MPAKRQSKLSFTDLSKRVDQPEPLEVEVAPDVWLTFHDPFEGNYDEEFEMPETPAEQMRKLLGDEAYEEFRSKNVNLSGRTYIAITTAVMEHFRLGEDSAS